MTGDEVYLGGDRAMTSDEFYERVITDPELSHHLVNIDIARFTER